MTKEAMTLAVTIEWNDGTAKIKRMAITVSHQLDLIRVERLLFVYLFI